MDATILTVMLKHILQGLNAFNFDVLAIVMDGAGCNRGFANDMATLTAEQLLEPGDIEMFQNEYPKINLTIPIAMPHPFAELNGRPQPIFFIFDPPHLIKKIRNAMHTSDKNRKFNDHGFVANITTVNEPRDLKVPKSTYSKTAPFNEQYDVVNLKMVARAAGFMESYRPTYSNELQTHKFIHAHFYPDGAKKMNVGIAAAIFSNKAQTMIKQAQSDGRLSYMARDLPSYANYGGLLNLMYIVNRFFDICNSRVDLKKKIFYGRIRANDVHHQLPKLLETLDFFTQWKAKLNTCDDMTDAQKSASFLPPETWTEIQGVCLGLFVMSRVFLTYSQFLPWLFFGRINQDPAENHFANVRYFSNGAKGLTVSLCYSATGMSCAMNSSKLTLNSKKRNQNHQLDQSESLDKPWNKKRYAKRCKQDFAESMVTHSITDMDWEECHRVRKRHRTSSAKCTSFTQDQNLQAPQPS